QVGDRFDVARGNDCRTIHYLIDIICTTCNDFIIWPKGSNLINVANSFNTLRVNNFPNVIGAIDGCHIQITVPLNKRKDYTNRKMFQSIVLLAVCKSNLEITYVFAGWPGSSHDACVYRNSSLGKCLIVDDCNLFPSEYHILAFPLSKRLFTPYRQRKILTPTQGIYNKRLSSTRVVIEQAFGLLLGRFRRLKSVCMKNVDNISKAVTACCILHNIALQNDDYTWVPIDSNPDATQNEFVNDGINQQDN
ncbi:protein ALP1-like, partial [Aphis craccivora]